MKIIFVRHGHPDYKKDCLTELGHLHAKAAAERLRNEKIDSMYASTCGRAVETAEYIAAVHNMSVEKYDFMREINWGSIDDEPIFENGHPWYTVDNMVAKGQSVRNADWASQEPFHRNKVTTSVQNVADNFDKWLASFGYEREGMYYRVARKNTDTLVMVSHAGSSSAVFSRLFNMDFPFVCATIKPDFTAITIVSFEGEEGSLISPSFELMNDARHIQGICAEKVFGR